MFTYVGIFKVAPVAREHLDKTPEYFDKIHKIVEEEGGTVERFLAIMGPWDIRHLRVSRSRGRVPRSRQDRKARDVRDRDVPRRGRQGVLEGTRLELTLHQSKTEAAPVAASVCCSACGPVGRLGQEAGSNPRERFPATPGPRTV